MTPEQDRDIDNALLTLMFEWKTGMTDQQQALKEFKQCLKYYSRMEDVVVLEENNLVSEREILEFGHDRVEMVQKRRLSEQLVAKAIEKELFFYEEITPFDQRDIPHRRFRMKMELIIPKKPKST